MATSPIGEAFEAAKREFLRESNKAKDIDLASFTTMEDVYDATDKIQKQQSQSKKLRYLQRIQPYLACINHYAGVVETFAQTKPEIISPIWGCIKAILLIASSYIRSYDKIIEAMMQLANVLPDFERYAEIFRDNERVKHALVLFYKDILDFHATVLQFFSVQSWRLLLESIWPKYHGKLMVILENITRNRSLMDSAVTLKDITEAHQARINAYKKYEKDYQFQERQDFEAAKNGLSPNLYYLDLGRIWDRCSVKSGQWLHQVEQYQNWIDPKNNGLRLVWLQGIPGAGKTCLSSLIIHQLQKRGECVAFLLFNYQVRSESSLLKVIHSIILQLANSNTYLRPLVSAAYTNDLDQLSSSVEYSTDLLKNMLHEVSIPYIVIDGLDEVTESDRPRLLRFILELHDAQNNLKLLISSRAEQDISRVLGPKVEPIRIQDGNCQDIQTYVSKRVDEFTSIFSLDSETLGEFQALGTNIGTNSKGMFLYAKLVCDNLEAQDTLDQIKEEANNLPDGLDQAYGRIMERIDKDLRPREREQARTILEWVGCCCAPVTKHEILLALRCRNEDPSKGCQGILLNIFQRCGPIVEESDGYVDFVHFTAREYLFGSQSDYYLKETQAHATIASICVRYLCSDCFSPGLEQQQVEGRVLNGAYVLENYACLYWLEHVKKSARDKAKTLIDDLEGLLENRKNSRFHTDPNSSMFSAPDLKPFEDISMEAHEDLLVISIFVRKRWRELSFADAPTLMKADPLTVSATQISIRTIFEGLFCPSEEHKTDCKCSRMQKFYGSRLYRCSRPGCVRFRNGFETKAERDRHLLVHNRPFKCDNQSCDFSILGFRTEAQLQTHFLRAHQEHIATVNFRKDAFNSEKEVELILLDAIKSDHHELVHDLREEVSQFSDECIYACLKEEKTSATMLELLLGICNDVENPHRMIDAAITLPSPEYLRLLLRYGVVEINSPGLNFENAARSRSPEMFEFLTTIRPEVPLYELGAYSLFFDLIPKKPDIHEEAVALDCIRLIESRLSQSDYTQILRRVSKSCFSLQIAEFSLRNGATMGGPNGADAPIWHASKSKSLAAARFMEYMLRCDANSDLMVGGKHLRDKLGPKNIAKWFGMTWDEFVKDCRKRSIEL